MAAFLDPGNTGATTLQGMDGGGGGDDGGGDDGGGDDGGGDGNSGDLFECASTTPFNCVDDSTTLCLDRGRYAVRAGWNDGSEVQLAKVARLNGQDIKTDNQGLMYFFDANNWELMVKVLDGCHINDHKWLFGSANTNIEYTLWVADSQTGEVLCYDNPVGMAAMTVADTQAFATCP